MNVGTETEDGFLPSFTDRSDAAAARFHVLMTPSWSAEMSVLLSAVHSRQVTGARWPASTCSAHPAPRSYMRTYWSSPVRGERQVNVET